METESGISCRVSPLGVDDLDVDDLDVAAPLRAGQSPSGRLSRLRAFLGVECSQL